MSKYREDSYIFCASLIRASENRFLPEAELVKAAEAKDFDEAMAVVASHGYGDGKPLENPRSFVNILNEEETEAYEMVFSALPERNELDLLKLPKDYHNAKAILKAEFLNTSPEPYLVLGGLLKREALIEMIKDRNYAFLSTEMKEAIAEAIDIFSKGRDPQEVDIILDKACYKEMYARAEAFGNSFLLDYIRLSIDLLNVTTFVRLKQMKKPWDFFKKVFLEGGNIKENIFVGGYEEPYQQLAERFAPYGFREIIEKGAVAARDTGLYSLMEKLCDNKRIEFIKNSRFVSFGIEPAIAYIVAKESEIKNLRMILNGKIANTPKEVILERLRETYV